MEIKDSVLSIADDYETFFLDIYGVLYDGIGLYSQTLATLKELKDRGKTIVLLSNLTLMSEEAKMKYGRMGMIPEEHYDELITSGQFLHDTIKNDTDKLIEISGKKIESYKCLFMANTALFDELDIKEVDAKDADFIYVGLPRASYGSVRMDDVYDCSTGEKINIENVIDSDWRNVRDSRGRQGFLEFAFQLEACLRMNKTLLIANPDIFSRSSQKDSEEPATIITQGGVGAYYEKMGGRVVYFGKPYSGIFKRAQEIAHCKGPILMVGDTPWTDVLGANACGLDSALITETGVAYELIKNMDASMKDDEKRRVLFEEITSQMTKLDGAMEPNHFIKRFACQR